MGRVHRDTIKRLPVTLLQKRQDKVAALRVFDALGPDDAIDAASIVSELNDALRKPDVLALLARTGTEFGTPQDHA